MTNEYRSEAFAAIHETMESLHEVGAIDKRTMRDFDGKRNNNPTYLNQQQLA